MRRFILGALAALSLTAPAAAQGSLPPGTICNSQSGFAKVVGQIQIGDTVLLSGTDCNNLTLIDGGTGGFASVQALFNFIMTANNNAPQLKLFRAQNADIVTVTSQFNAQFFDIAAQSFGAPGGGNAILGAAIQDVNNLHSGGCPGADGTCTSFPAGITGYGLISTGVGNYVYGGFFRCDNLVNGSCQGIETDCSATTDSPNQFPPILTAPVLAQDCNGIQSVNIGAGKGHMAYRAVATGGAWLASFYADPPKTGNQYGIFIDSGTTIGPIFGGLFRHTGIGGGYAVLAQTTGTFTPSNPVIAHQNINSGTITTYQVLESGEVQSNHCGTTPVISHPPSSFWASYDQTCDTTSNASLTLDTYNAAAPAFNSLVLFRTAAGTQLAPTALGATNPIGNISAQACVGGPPCAFGTASGRIQFTYLDGGTNLGTAIDFFTQKIGTTGAGNRLLNGRLDDRGHLQVGNTTNVPTASGCAGFALGAGSTDAAGRITFTSATTCGIAFGGGAFTNNPSCSVTPTTASTVALSSVSTAGFTATFGTAQTGLSYICLGV